jgi:hypothetical protein
LRLTAPLGREPGEVRKVGPRTIHGSAHSKEAYDDGKRFPKRVLPELKRRNPRPPSPRAPPLRFTPTNRRREQWYLSGDVQGVGECIASHRQIRQPLRGATSKGPPASEGGGWALTSPKASGRGGPRRRRPGGDGRPGGGRESRSRCPIPPFESRNRPSFPMSRSPLAPREAP